MMRELGRAIILGAAFSAFGTAADAGDVRLASDAAWVRPALDEGRARSATFAELLAAIADSDLIVYVRTITPVNDVLRSYVTFVAATPSTRILSISISRREQGAPLVALFAHELQHACEIAARADVVDLASLERFYRRRGIDGGWHRHLRGYDSAAAIVTEAVVLREVAASRVSESVVRGVKRSY